MKYYIKFENILCVFLTFATYFVIKTRRILIIIIEKIPNIYCILVLYNNLSKFISKLIKLLLKISILSGI